MVTPGGVQLGQPALQPGGDLGRVLVGDQAEAELGAGRAGQDGLGPFALIAAPQAVDVEGGAGPAAFQGGVARLADGPGHADLLEVFLLVEGQGGELRPLAVRKRHHVVVEAGDRHAALLVDQARQDGAQGVGRIGHRAAERAGVEVAVRAGHAKLEVGQAAQAVVDGRDAGGELVAVANHHAVAGQPVGVLAKVLLQGVAADLLLALDEELQVQGQAALDGDPGLGALQVGEHLAFVVGGAAGVEVAVAAGRLEGGVVHFSSGSGGCTS